MEKLNVIILGAGVHPQEQYPTCLTEYEGITILEYIVEKNLLDLDINYSFVFLERDTKNYHLDNIAKVLTKNPKIVKLANPTNGSASTALFAACSLDQDLPLFIISTNEIVKVNYQKVIHKFISLNAFGGLMTFKSTHPRYSYVEVDGDNIIEVTQQNPISELATTGSFWFRNTSDFVQAAQKSIIDDCSTNERFFIAPTFNQLILEGKKISLYDIESNYIPFKSISPISIEKYKKLL